MNYPRCPARTVPGSFVFQGPFFENYQKKHPPVGLAGGLRV